MISAIPTPYNSCSRFLARKASVKGVKIFSCGEGWQELFELSWCKSGIKKLWVQTNFLHSFDFEYIERFRNVFFGPQTLWDNSNTKNFNIQLTYFNIEKKIVKPSIWSIIFFWMKLLHSVF